MTVIDLNGHICWFQTAQMELCPNLNLGTDRQFRLLIAEFGKGFAVKGAGLDIPNLQVRPILPHFRFPA